MNVRNIISILVGIFLSLSLSAQEGVPREGLGKVDRKACENALLSAVEQANKGQIENEKSILNQILKKDPSDDASHYYLGLCMFVSGDREQAQLHLEKAVQLDSANYWYRHFLGLFYLNTGQNEAATTLYEGIIKDFSKKRPEDYYTLANLYAGADRKEEAYAILDKIDSQTGLSDATTMMRFRLLCSENKQQEAYDFMKKANAEVESPQIKCMLGDYELSLGNDTTAFNLYDEALAIVEGYAPALVGKAEVHKNRHQYSDFFSLTEQFIRSDDVTTESKCEYLQSLLQRPDARMEKACPGELEKLIRLCAEKHPDSPDPGRVLCALYYGSNDLAALAKTAEEYSEKFPEEPLFLDLAIYSRYNLDNHEAVARLSETKVERAIADGDKDRIVEAKAALGDAYYKLGQNKKAFKIYSEVLKLKSDYAPTLNNYAYFLSQTGGSLRRAYKMSKKAVDLDPDNATYLDTFGWILHLQGKDTEALAIFKRVMIYGGKDNSEVLRHYAEVLSCCGKEDLAQMYRSQAAAKEKAGK